MRRNAWHVLAVLAMAGLMNATAADAEEVYSPGTNEEGSYVSDDLASLGAEINSLDQRMDAGLTAGYENGEHCGGCDAGRHGGCGCEYDRCCPSGGWIAGAELLWLKPHHGNGVGRSSEYVLDDPPLFGVGGIDPDFEVSPRFWLGYVRCDGLGVRLRYWEFDHDSSQNVVTSAGEAEVVFHGWNTWVLDLEVTHSAKLGCYWDAAFSVGFRYVDYAEEARITEEDGDLNIVRNNITGYGLTAGAELRRPLTCALAGFVKARFSVIMGDENNFAFEGGPGFVEYDVFDVQLDDVKRIYEVQAGVEYAISDCCGRHWFVRGGFEVQYWDAFGVDNQPIDGDEEVLPAKNASTGFAGFFLSAGLNR